MSDLLLKIRQCKRSGGTKIDISGLGLSSIPSELLELTSLESINISNNSLNGIDKISIFRNLKELIASNNNISVIPDTLQTISSLETLRLDGNPIAVSSPGLAVAFGSDIQKEFGTYFGKAASPSGGASPFLGSGLNDAASLRKKIAELQIEVNQLKQGSGSEKPATLDNQRNWLSPGGGGGFGGGMMERPTTASSQAKKVQDIQEELDIEKNNNKRLQTEVNLLKAEVSKNVMINATSPAHGQGRINGIPGVREIDMDELEIGEQIGQGGFSVIKKAMWRGTETATKIIFDPVMTDDLLEEVTNEVRMLSILRHPNIVLLMGISTKPPNMAIMFENVSKGCLFNYLHLSHDEIEMSI